MPAEAASDLSGCSVDVAAWHTHGRHVVPLTEHQEGVLNYYTQATSSTHVVVQDQGAFLHAHQSKRSQIFEGRAPANMSELVMRSQKRVMELGECNKNIHKHIFLTICVQFSIHI